VSSPMGVPLARKDNELAPPHSITSSAVICMINGTCPAD
jgi:hypothetical protein